jgi:hypothetical protein
MVRRTPAPHIRRMTQVSRKARLFDLAALAGILIGALLCWISNGQLKDISRYSYQHPGPPSVSQLTAADHARYLAYGGLSVIAAGIAIGVAGMLIGRAVKKNNN